MLNQLTNSRVSSLLRKRANIAPEKCSLCAGIKLTLYQSGVHFAPENVHFAPDFLSKFNLKKVFSLRRNNDRF
jgi:hypothetical protein